MLACQQWLCGFRQVSRLVSAHSRTSLCSIFNVPAMCTCAIIGVPFVCHATSTGTLGFLFPPPAGQYAKLHASSSVWCVFCSSTKETAVCGQHYLHWDLIATDTHFWTCWIEWPWHVLYITLRVLRGSLQLLSYSSERWSSPNRYATHRLGWTCLGEVSIGGVYISIVLNPNPVSLFLYRYGSGRYDRPTFRTFCPILLIPYVKSKVVYQPTWAVCAPRPWCGPPGEAFTFRLWGIRIQCRNVNTKTPPGAVFDQHSGQFNVWQNLQKGSFLMVLGVVCAPLASETCACYGPRVLIPLEDIIERYATFPFMGVCILCWKPLGT